MLRVSRSLMAVVVDFRGPKVLLSGISRFLGTIVSFGDGSGLGMYSGGMVVWYAQIKV